MPNNENTGSSDDLNLLRQQLRHGDGIIDQRHIDDLIAKLTPRREELRPREKDENFELVDAAGNGRKLTAPRWICHLLGLRHRCAHVLIVAYHPGMGRVYILQIRSSNTSDSPGHLDISAAGHAVDAVSVDETAVAELFEELGLRTQDLCGGELQRVGRYEHDEARPTGNFNNCEWREVYVGILVPDGLAKLRLIDGEVSGLFFCPEGQVEDLLKQTQIPIASALRMSLPVCLRTLGVTESPQYTQIQMPDPSGGAGTFELRVRLNGVMAAFRREPGCRCARCTDPDLRQNGNTSASIILARNNEILEHHLVDAGLGVVDNLVQWGGPWPLTSLWLTHAHFDHVANIDIRADLATRRDTSGDRFVITIDGQEIRDRGIAGELILRRAMRLRGSEGEQQIGRFAGFQLVIADSYARGPEVLLGGAALHVAKVTDTALGTIRSVEHAIQSLDQVATDTEKTIKEARKRATDLTAQLDQPFEYADRLAPLAQRQQEITDSLDLTKNQASGQLEADPTKDQSFAEPDGDSMKEEFDDEWL